MNVDFFLDSFFWVSYTCSSNYSVYDGVVVYVHSLVSRTFSAQSALTPYFAHFSCVSHTRMAQSVCRKVFACVSLLSISPSPFSCFTRLCCSFSSTLTSHFSPHVLVVFSRPESAGHAPLRTRIAKFGNLAKSDANTGYEPNEFDKITSVDNDTTPINDPNYDDISDFSKNTHENIGLFDVLTLFVSSVSHVSHDDFALQN